MKYHYLALCLLLLGAGCSVSHEGGQKIELGGGFSMAVPVEVADDSRVTFPVQEYAQRRTQKGFGEYIADRFTGYHAGEDVEFIDIEGEVPVVAIADGLVLQSRFVPGYGGFLLIEHPVEAEVYRVVYGHVDLAQSVQEGERVEKGQRIAVLGDHLSGETDGERKHLHFAIYQGGDERTAGYVPRAEDLARWVNPQDFFLRFGPSIKSESRIFGQQQEAGEQGDYADIAFEVPPAWEVEYVPELSALNLYTREGGDSARDRSQMFIRFFDASSFLTLNTVQIHSTENLVAGQEDYVARRYDIEKKPSVPDFSGQPSWRNERHIVTDVRGEDGRTRYYVFAASPGVDPAVYERLLDSIQLSKD